MNNLYEKILFYFKHINFQLFFNVIINIEKMKYIILKHY